MPRPLAPRPYLLVAVVALALAGVFALYTRADFLLQLSNQLWGCF